MKHKIWKVLSALALVCCMAVGFAACKPQEQEPPEETTYTVTYALGDHAADNAQVPASQTVAEGEMITLPAAVAAEEGWSFGGWKGSGDAVLAAGAEYAVTADVTFTAQWEEETAPVPVTYTVTYALGEHAAQDAQLPAAQTAEANTQITLAAAVSAAEGWTFRGWTDGTKTYAAGEQFAVTANVTLTAVWEEVPPAPVTYTVTYALGEHAAQGAQLPAAQTAEANTQITLPAAVSAAEGWAFRGWTDGTKTYAAGETFPVTADVTLTAVWEEVIPPAPVTYTVTYALGEHAAQGAQLPAAQTAQENTQITLAAAVSAAEGWTFQGWTDGAKTYAAGETFTVTADVTLTAVWKEAVITVRFDANGGTGTMAEDTFVYGDNYHFPALTFTAPEGMQLRGWSPDKVTIFSPAISENGYRAFIVGNAITFYAMWQEIPPVMHTITFELGMHAAEGSEVPAPMTAAEGSEITMPTAPAAEEGWEFFGWVFDGYRYDPGTPYRVVSDVTFTAVWALIMPEIPATYTLSYYSGVYSGSGIAGETPAAVQVEAGAAFTFPASPWTRDGYTFAGWKVQHNTAAEGEEAYWEDLSDAVYQPNATFTMPAEDVRLTATWEKVIINVTVKFDANGGTGSMADDAFELGKTYWLPEEIGFTAPTGMQFAGWSLDKTELLNTAISQGDYRDFVVDNVLTVYAMWENVPVYSDIAEIAGVWKNGDIELVVSETGADATEGIVGTVIFGGVAFAVYAMPDGTFYGYDFRYNEYVLSFADEILTVEMTGESVQTSIFEGKTPLSEDAASATLGRWVRSDTAQKWLITQDTAYYGNNLSQASVTMIDKYVLIRYMALGTEYCYVLSAANDGLAGTFYGDMETPVQQVSFSAGSYFTLTVEGVLNQFVDAGTAPDATKIVVPTAPEGQTFDKWVTADTQTDFDLSAVMTADASITAVFAQSSAAEAIYEGEYTHSSFLGSFTIVAFSVNVDEMKLAYRLEGATDYTEVSVTDESDSQWKPSGVGTYWDVSIENTPFYVGFSADQSTLYLCNFNDEEIATFTKGGGEAPDTKVTVTFVNGKTVFATAEVSVGETVAIPTDIPVSESGKAFRYWTDENGEYDFDTPISADLTLYAAFAWKVTFDVGEGASGSVAPVWVTIWTPRGIPLPTSDGLSNGTKQFGGWMYAGQVYAGGSSFIPEDYTQLGNVTFTAVWEEEPAPTMFEITFTDADGSNYGTFTTTTSGWLNSTNRPEDPVKSGYAFLYWALDDGTQIDLGTYYFEADTTVYAIFLAVVSNAEFVGVWSDATHEVVIVSMEGWDGGEYLYAVLDGMYFAYEAEPGTQASRTLLNALDRSALCTLSLSDGALTVTYANTETFTIAARTETSVQSVTFEQLNGKQYKNDTTQISFMIDEYGYPVVTVNENASWDVNGIVGAYINIVLADEDYAIVNSYLLCLEGNTLSGYDVNGMPVIFTEVQESQPQITYEDGLLTYVDEEGVSQSMLFSLESNKGTVSVGSEAFYYENGLYLDLAMVCVEGLASDERVVGFVMDGVLYAADDAVALTGQEMRAVVEDTSVAFGSPDAAQWNIPQWQSVLRKGESAVYYGRMTSDGKLNYNTIHVLLWQTLNAQGGADGVVRMDWYVQGQDSDVATTNVPDMNWTVTKRLGPDWTTYLATIQSCSVTVVLQWKNPECLQVAYFVQGDNGISFPMIYDIRAASGSLPDWYCIGFSARAQRQRWSGMKGANTAPITSATCAEPSIGRRSTRLLLLRRRRQMQTDRSRSAEILP